MQLCQRSTWFYILALINIFFLFHVDAGAQETISEIRDKISKYEREHGQTRSLTNLIAGLNDLNDMLPSEDSSESSINAGKIITGLAKVMETSTKVLFNEKTVVATSVVPVLGIFVAVATFSIQQYDKTKEEGLEKKWRKVLGDVLDERQQKKLHVKMFADMQSLLRRFDMIAYFTENKNYLEIKDSDFNMSDWYSGKKRFIRTSDKSNGIKSMITIGFRDFIKDGDKSLSILRYYINMAITNLHGEDEDIDLHKQKAYQVADLLYWYVIIDSIRKAVQEALIIVYGLIEVPGLAAYIKFRRLDDNIRNKAVFESIQKPFFYKEENGDIKFTNLWLFMKKKEKEYFETMKTYCEDLDVDKFGGETVKFKKGTSLGTSKYLCFKKNDGKLKMCSDVDDDGTKFRLIQNSFKENQMSILSEAYEEFLTATESGSGSRKIDFCNSSNKNTKEQYANAWCVDESMMIMFRPRGKKGMLRPWGKDVLYLMENDQDFTISPLRNRERSLLFLKKQ